MEFGVYTSITLPWRVVIVGYSVNLEIVHGRYIYTHTRVVYIYLCIYLYISHVDIK